MTDTWQVTGYEATQAALHEALAGSEIVLIPAGVPRKPGMTRDGEQIETSNEWSWHFLVQLTVA
jgi:malate/lactate dehydrogenase